MEKQEMIRWFRNAGYGMMAHWGLYSLLGPDGLGRIPSFSEEALLTAARKWSAEFKI